MKKRNEIEEAERWAKGADMILWVMLIIQLVVTVGLFVGAVTKHLPF